MSLKFIFIAGVEGCGHHGLLPVVDTAIRASVQANGDDSKVLTRWPMLRELFNALWYTQSLASQQQQHIRNRLDELMLHGVALANSTGCSQYILEDNSFPSGMNRCLSRQWDIVEMTELLRPHAEIRFLALYRDPIAMTFSHPEFDGGLRKHAKMVAAFLKYLNDKLMRIDPELVKVVHYEDLVDGQDRLAEPLAMHLGVDVDFINAGFQKVCKSRKDWRLQMAREDRDWMSNYFGQDRLTTWPVFTDLRYDILS